MIQDTPNSEGQTLKAHNKVESYESRRKKQKARFGNGKSTTLRRIKETVPLRPITSNDGTPEQSITMRGQTNSNWWKTCDTSLSEYKQFL